VASRANGRAVCRWMRMWGVRAHGDMDRDRYVRPVRHGDYTMWREFRLRERLQAAAERLSDPDAVSLACGNRFIHLAARLFCCAEAPVGKHSFDILTGLTRDGDFEIVDGSRAVHDKSGHPPAMHQVHQYIAKATLDHVTAHAPENRALPRARLANSLDNAAERIRSKNFRKRIQQASNTTTLPVRFCKMLNLNLPAAVADRNCLQGVKGQRFFFIAAQGFLPSPSTFFSARAVWLLESFTMSSGEPHAITWPPPSPPSGPRSIIQSAVFTTSN
jgi:hypothetical protein